VLHLISDSLFLLFFLNVEINWNCTKIKYYLCSVMAREDLTGLCQGWYLEFWPLPLGCSWKMTGNWESRAQLANPVIISGIILLSNNSCSTTLTKFFGTKVCFCKAKLLPVSVAQCTRVWWSAAIIIDNTYWVQVRKNVNYHESIGILWVGNFPRSGNETLRMEGLNIFFSAALCTYWIWSNLCVIFNFGLVTQT